MRAVTNEYTELRQRLADAQTEISDLRKQLHAVQRASISDQKAFLNESDLRKKAERQLAVYETLPTNGRLNPHLVMGEVGIHVNVQLSNPTADEAFRTYLLARMAMGRVIDQLPQIDDTTPTGPYAYGTIRVEVARGIKFQHPCYADSLRPLADYSDPHPVDSVVDIPVG